MKNRPAFDNTEVVKCCKPYAAVSIIFLSYGDIAYHNSKYEHFAAGFLVYMFHNKLLHYIYKEIITSGIVSICDEASHSAIFMNWCCVFVRWRVRNTSRLHTVSIRERNHYCSEIKPVSDDDNSNIK